jgi:hypothetical protein
MIAPKNSYLEPKNSYLEPKNSYFALCDGVFMRVSGGSKILKVLKVLKNKQKEIANSVDNSILFFCFLLNVFLCFFELQNNQFQKL